ncbi:hypothetical protein ACHAWF_011306 [Thalassiosira exigua]
MCEYEQSNQGKRKNKRRHAASDGGGEANPMRIEKSALGLTPTKASPEGDGVADGTGTATSSERSPQLPLLHLTPRGHDVNMVDVDVGHKAVTKRVENENAGPDPAVPFPPVDRANIEIRLINNRAIIECKCCVTHKTGVQMEAMTGATIAALAVYDMVKSVSHDVEIREMVLVSKSGGKSDFKRE